MYGTAATGAGMGVYGRHVGSTGTGPGVRGESASASAPGVLGSNSAGGPGLESIVSSNSVAPLKVNSSAQVANLNASLLGGHGSSFFLPATGTAADSDKLDGRDSTGFQQRVSGNCASGEAIRVINVDGTVSCQAVGGSAGVTSVDSGTGLSGGPITTMRTLSVASGYRLPQDCSNDQVAKSDGSNSWSCAADANSGGTVTSVGSGTGLTGGPITGSGILSLATGYQLLQSCTASARASDLGTPNRTPKQSTLDFTGLAH